MISSRCSIDANFFSLYFAFRSRTFALNARALSHTTETLDSKALCVCICVMTRKQTRGDNKISSIQYHIYRSGVYVRWIKDGAAMVAAD
jgi:hypothetical protein